MKRQCQDHGSSPGSPFGDVGNILAPPSVADDVLVDAHALFVPSQIAAPTVQELSHALEMGSSVNFENSGECFRVLFAQNRLLLRAEIHRSHPYSTVSLGNSSGSSRALSSSPLLSSSSNSSGNARSLGISPPKNFQCPVCFTFNNEKDFDRHVQSRIKNAPHPVLLKAVFVLVFVQSIMFIARTNARTTRQSVKNLSTSSSRCSGGRLLLLPLCGEQNNWDEALACRQPS